MLILVDRGQLVADWHPEDLQGFATGQINYRLYSTGLLSYEYNIFY